MRLLILTLLIIWSGLTAIGYLFVRPDSSGHDSVIAAYFAIADDPGHPKVAALLIDFADSLALREDLPPLPPEGLVGIPTLPAQARQLYYNAFREFYDARSERPLAQTPTLVWTTDDNPARPVQSALFRQWHLRNYGEPVDILTDPSNRDITKAIVQSVAGSGPDIIEAYGPVQLNQIVDAGFAFDITEIAEARGFATDTVFPAAVSSIARPDPETGELRQFAYPCNVGYTVLFYHKDLFQRAGVTEPSGPWSLDELVRRSLQLADAGVVKRPFIFVNFSPWDITLPLGIDFFNEEGTASEFNQPEAIAALQIYLDIVYRHKITPSPAEAASKATSGGANMNADAQSASASAFFLNRDAAMVIDGRWQYVNLANKNMEIIRPAMDRRIAALARDDSEAAQREAALLREARRKLAANVLNVLTDDEFEAMERAITPEDRTRMLNIGIAHVPTITGVPYYKAGARIAIVNRESRHRDLAVRFLEFLASAEYNNQINAWFDSISGVPAFCLGPNGISGPPRPLPGLEEMDSPIFVEAMMEYAHPETLSPFIGRNRLGMLVAPFLERLENNGISASECAAAIERVINDQISQNLRRDASLRAEWERRVGASFDPGVDLRTQVEAARAARQESSATTGAVR